MKVNLWVLIVCFAFVVGIICGLLLGIDTGTRKTFEGIATILAGSNVSISVDLNETQIVEGFSKQLIPFINQTIQEKKELEGKT